jgi:hypothetical protein
MPSTRSPLRCVHRLASGDIIEPRRAEAFPRPSVRQPAVTASIRSNRTEAFQDDQPAMQGDSLWGVDRSYAESGMVTKSTPANKSACDCTIANPSQDERSPHSTHSRCGDALPAQDRRASARRGSVNRTPCESNVFDDRRTDAIKSGGREPAVGAGNAVAIADAFVQRPASARRWSETTVATATRWISAFRVRIPNTSHGGLRPPLLRCRANVYRRKTIFAMQKRICARAAGVSPPWSGEPSAVPRKPRNVRRPCDAGPRAAGVSPSWVCTRWSVAHGVRQITCKHVSRTTRSLRPPLLLQCERLSAKKRFLRCTNAGSQERRASARRGTVNRTPCRRNHALFNDHATQEQERRA